MFRPAHCTAGDSTLVVQGIEVQDRLDGGSPGKSLPTWRTTGLS